MLLSAESDTNLGHTSVYAVVDGEDQPDFGFDALLDGLAERLASVPELTQRIREVPLRLDRPWWEPDPSFDLGYHVRHIGVPASGRGDLAIKELALLARVHERPINRNRPLWELYLIDRPDGRSGILAKVHHALIDGVTGLDLVDPLTPEEPLQGDDVERIPDPDVTRGQRSLSDGELLRRAAVSQATSPYNWGRLGVSLARNIPVVGSQILPTLAAQWASPSGDVEVESSDHVVPRLSFNRTLGPNRRIAVGSLAVEDIRQVRQSLSVRFNDVLLAVVGGGMRRWLQGRGELPDESVVALAPILIDSTDQPLGTALVGLATDEADSVQRVSTVHDTMAAMADQLGAQPVDTIRHLYQASPAVAAMAARLVARTSAASRFHPPFNVLVVSVPGSRSPLSILGADVDHRWALPSLVDGCGLAVCILSRDTTIDVSVVADRDLVPDVNELAVAISDELDALVKQA